MDALSAAKIAFNLRIYPTTKEGIIDGVPFIAMFNPESFSIKEAVCWNVNAPATSDGSDPGYIKTKARNFSLEFTLDGTGVNTNGFKVPVTAQVALFRHVTTRIVSKTHRPGYLLVQFGTFITLCVMNSSSITYSVFDMFGFPIRAKITAEFTERRIPEFDSKINMLSSPDLTHQVQVKEYDLLPYLVFKTYNKQDYYLQVARVNRIKNFRKLDPGVLIFPPIDSKKTEKLV